MSNDFASQMILQKCIKPFINFLNIEMHRRRGRTGAGKTLFASISITAV